MSNLETLKPQLNRVQTLSLITGLVALALCGLGAYTNPGQFFKSYLLGYMFWIGLPLGSFVILCLHHLVGGRWGFAIQRILEAGSRTIPLMALLLIPLFFGMKELYVWARPETVALDEILQHKSAYLNVSAFWIRAVLYFLLWTGLIFLMTKWSYRQDETGESGLTSKVKMLSGPGIILYVLSLTFASVDWVMSLDPHWFSTIFGFIFVIGQVLLTLSFAVIILNWFAEVKPLSDFVKSNHFHDLGNLILAFVSLWAYMALSQFLIIWSGNLPEEIPWYLDRMHGGWDTVGVIIVLFHFTVPFALLLSRDNKRNGRILAKIAVAIIIMRFVDLDWIIMPSFHPEQFAFHWMDLAAPVAIGGLWFTAFLRQVKKKELLPMHDPRLKEALLNESH